MPISLEQYRKNQEGVLQELEQLKSLFDGRIGAYDGFTNDQTVVDVDKFRESINYILTDAQKAKEQEEKDREREEQIKQGLDPDAEERNAQAIAEMEDLEAEMSGQPKKQREAKPARYQTDVATLQTHLNNLGKMNNIFKEPTKGKYSKTVGEMMMPDVKARKQMHGIMESLDNKLGTTLAPKKVTGMYYDDYLGGENALKNIDNLKERFKDPSYNDKNVVADEKREMVAAIMASRMAVNSKRGDSSSLEKPIDEAKFKKHFQNLLNNDGFKRFVDSTPTSKLRDALSGGHGGALEDQFRKFNTEQTIVPQTSKRHAPTALERIDFLKKAMKARNLPEDRKADLVKEIMATRLAVDAVQNQKSSLKKPVDAQKIEEARKKLESNKTFTDMLKDPKKLAAMEKALKSGHGGAIERYVQKETALKEDFNENNPEWLSPKKPELPKSFDEAASELQKISASRTPVNPHVVRRNLLAAVYYANAEKNPNVDKITIEQNAEKRMEEISKEGTFNYMMEKQGPQQMMNHVSMGANSLNSAFATAKAINDTKKIVQEMEAKGKVLGQQGVGEVNQEEPQAGPQVGPA